VLSRLIARRGYARVLACQDYQVAWGQAVGTPLARHSRAGNLRRGVLEVIVRDSTVLQELSFQRKQILFRLRQQLADESICELRFRIGQIDEEVPGMDRSPMGDQIAG
jgi:predicted nucleic acid-binding Zn ribbon protein